MAGGAAAEETFIVTPAQGKQRGTSSNTLLISGDTQTRYRLTYTSTQCPLLAILPFITADSNHLALSVQDRVATYNTTSASGVAIRYNNSFLDSSQLWPTT